MIRILTVLAMTLAASLWADDWADKVGRLPAVEEKPAAADLMHAVSLAMDLLHTRDTRPEHRDDLSHEALRRYLIAALIAEPQPITVQLHEEPAWLNSLSAVRRARQADATSVLIDRGIMAEYMIRRTVDAEDFLGPAETERIVVDLMSRIPADADPALQRSCVQSFGLSRVMRRHPILPATTAYWTFVRESVKVQRRMLGADPECKPLQDMMLDNAGTVDFTERDVLRAYASMRPVGENRRRFLDIAIAPMLRADLGEDPEQLMLPLVVLRDPSRFAGLLTGEEHAALAAQLAESTDLQFALRAWFLCLGTDVAATREVIQVHAATRLAGWVSADHYGDSSSEDPIDHLHELLLLTVLEPAQLAPITETLRPFALPPAGGMRRVRSSADMSWRSPKGYAGHLIVAHLLAATGEAVEILGEGEDRMIIGVLREDDSLLHSGRIAASPGEPTEAELSWHSFPADPNGLLLGLHPGSEYAAVPVAGHIASAVASDPMERSRGRTFLWTLVASQEAAEAHIARPEVRDALVALANTGGVFGQLRTRLENEERIERRAMVEQMMTSQAKRPMDNQAPEMAAALIARHVPDAPLDRELLAWVVVQRHATVDGCVPWSGDLQALATIAPDHEAIAAVRAHLAATRPDGYGIALWLLDACAGKMPDEPPPIAGLARSPVATQMLQALAGYDVMLAPHRSALRQPATVAAFAFHGLDVPGKSREEAAVLMAYLGLLARLQRVAEDPGLSYRYAPTPRER